MTALKNQVGGDHYSKLRIQPVEYIHANGLGFCEGSIIKYVTRYKSKGGLDDLRKARHFLDLLIELETEPPPPDETPWQAPDFGASDCQHPPWRRYVSVGKQQCIDCGLELPLDDRAAQVKHTRKGGG